MTENASPKKLLAEATMSAQASTDDKKEGMSSREDREQPKSDDAVTRSNEKPSAEGQHQMIPNGKKQHVPKWRASNRHLSPRLGDSLVDGSHEVKRTTMADAALQEEKRRVTKRRRAMMKSRFYSSLKSGGPVFFYSRQLVELKESSATKNLTEPEKKMALLSSFLAECESNRFPFNAENWGLENPIFEPNRIDTMGGGHCAALYDRFVEACKSLPESATFAIVFHGTHERNINAILKSGLDPSKRKLQAYGPGEYFSSDPGLSLRYCNGGKTMLVFVVVLPSIKKTEAQLATSARHHTKDNNIIVIDNNDHQFPLGVLRFDAVSNAALMRSCKARNKLLQLSSYLQLAMEQTSEAKLKAKIIQCLIQDKLDVAGATFGKNEDSLSDTSKCEIAAFAFKKYDAEFITYYFPGLKSRSSPKTTEEEDEELLSQQEEETINLQSMTVEDLEKEVLNAQQKVERARLDTIKERAKKSQEATTAESAALIHPGGPLLFCSRKLAYLTGAHQ